MPRGDEQRVVDAFCAWLRQDGWTVETEIAFVDILARKGGTTLLAQAKSIIITSSPGIDIDTAYGQLLRRMPDRDHVDIELVAQQLV